MAIIGILIALLLLLLLPAPQIAPMARSQYFGDRALDLAKESTIQIAFSPRIQHVDGRHVGFPLVVISIENRLSRTLALTP